MTLGKDGVTTGASNDIQRASEIARNMVTKWGLSDKLGPLMYDEGGEEVFLGRSAGMPQKSVSAETARDIDSEVRSIIDNCYATAQRILEENVDKLHLMADALILYETLDASQLDSIMEGRMPDPPKEWDDDSSDSTSSSGSEQPVADKDGEDAAGPIGGPAQDH
jgi:cell division protease FtsH